MVIDSNHTSNGRLCPFFPVESFEDALNFPPDGTDINGHANLASAHHLPYHTIPLLNLTQPYLTRLDIT